MSHAISQCSAKLRSSANVEINTIAAAIAELHQIIVQLQIEVSKLKSAVSEDRDES